MADNFNVEEVEQMTLAMGMACLPMAAEFGIDIEALANESELPGEILGAYAFIAKALTIKNLELLVAIFNAELESRKE